MDGLTTWKNISNIFKDSVGKDYYNTIFSDDVLKYYDFVDNTVFLMCDNDFVRDNVEKNLSKLYAASAKIGIENITIKPISSAQEVISEFKKSSSAAKIQMPDNILEKFTFDNFVKGKSNEFARAACIAVAENPSFESPTNAYNPLLLYGGVGLGKTHLMHAIGNSIKSKNKNYKILYITSENFMNELIVAISEQKNKEFREKYRSLDCLMIDDVQFLAGKISTQEEIFHTFNDLYDANKQIILSSDRPPQDISTLQGRISSRFAQGLTADIQSPDFETRVAILKKKCELDQKYISDDILKFMAKNIKSNIRELEGALTKICAVSSLTNEPITYELAVKSLKDFFDSNVDNNLNVNTIKKEVARVFNIKVEDLSSERRTKDIAYPRQIAMYMARELTDLSLPNIGKHFGDRDHTTVMHACKRIKKDISSKKNGIDQLINEMSIKLKSNVDN